MELQRLRFLHRIWRKPSSQSFFLISVRDLAPQFKWISILLAVVGVLALGRLYPQGARVTHTWAGYILAPATGGIFFLEQLISEKIPTYLHTLNNAFLTLETQDQLLAEKGLLEKKIIFIQQENKELRSLLSLSPATEQISSSGTIIQRHHHLSSHTLVIRSPKECPHNAPVMTPQGLLGRIIETHKNTALVLLAQDARSRIPVLLGEQRVEAIAAGDGSHDLKLQYLDIHAEIKEGDTAITSGVGGVFPSGLSLGQIKRTTSGFVISPFASGNRGRFVKVLTPAEPTPSFKKIEPKKI